MIELPPNMGRVRNPAFTIYIPHGPEEQVEFVKKMCARSWSLKMKGHDVTVVVVLDIEEGEKKGDPKSLWIFIPKDFGEELGTWHTELKKDTKTGAGVLEMFEDALLDAKMRLQQGIPIKHGWEHECTNCGKCGKGRDADKSGPVLH